MLIVIVIIIHIIRFILYLFKSFFSSSSSSINTVQQTGFVHAGVRQWECCWLMWGYSSHIPRTDNHVTCCLLLNLCSQTPSHHDPATVADFGCG